MGFRCPECGKDFGTMAELDHHRENNRMCSCLIRSTGPDMVLEHIKKVREYFGIKPKRKRSVDLTAIEEAVKDGRLDIWVDGDGEIRIMNKRTGKTISVIPTRTMDNWMYEE